MAGKNVRFYVVDLREKFDALVPKDPMAIYWIEQTQELFKGDKLYGTGAMASEQAAGLLSKEDYAEFKKLIADIDLQSAAPGQIPFMGVEGKLVWNNVALRRDNDYNYKKIENTFVPINGEVCLVDVAGYGLRAKVGNGINTFAQLPYTDDALLQTIDSLIIKGYYYQGKFYKDAAHTELLTDIVGRIYIDAITSKIYTYNGLEYSAFLNSLPNATASIAGIMKLYDVKGQNVDGTITQRLFTEEINEKFEMDVIEEEEMIIFDNDIN